MNGIINFLKPAGMTSHDAISFFRKVTGIKKIGHTGTLDPMACGVLPICIGKSTRLIEYINSDKSYRTIMKLGVHSETQDIWGKDLRTVPMNKKPTLKEVESALNSFKGEVIQQVPGFSAQKHNGKKLYEYAREGNDIPVKKKSVNINNIMVIDYNISKNEVLFDLDCSKGTYVRTICHEAGKILNTNAVMSFLLRTSAGGMSINDAVTIEEIIDSVNEAGNIYKYLEKPEKYLELENIIICPNDATKFQNGISIAANVVDEVEYAVVIENNEKTYSLVGIGIGKNNSLKPKKVFPTEK